MKESYKEDLASNFGLELYADDGNGMGVATTGVYAGKLMSYDSVGNRRSLDAPDSGRFSYVYDAADQLSSVLNPFSELTTFSYDIAGRRTVQRYSNGTRASIIYDTANNVTQFHNRTSTGTAITTNDYKYDNVGNRTGMLEASGDRLTWTYDNGDQLKSERRSGASGYANTFTYDGVGNRTLKNAGATRTTFSYDVADQLVYSQAVAGRTSYVYDNAGNQQIERPPTGSRTTTVWDNENRPTLYRLPDTTLVTMSYNGNNHRVTKQSATETVKFVWDPAADAYLAEFNSSNVLQATYSQEPVQFGRALSQRRSTTSSWYHTDALGSTQALSNSSQITSDTYLYDAWGNPITSTGTTVNPFRWVGNVGYYFDSDTGLYYIRARTYQPIIARWTSADPLFYMLAKTGALRSFTRDPIGYMSGVFNIYEYCNGRVIGNIDPFGLLSTIAQGPTKITTIEDKCPCCCCPVSIVATSVVVTNSSGWMRYTQAIDITFTITMNYKKAPLGAKKTSCLLAFAEFIDPISNTSIPAGMPPGVWVDQVAAKPRNFDKWRDFDPPQQKNCNGSAIISLTDHSVATPKSGQVLNFWQVVLVRGGRDCKCEPDYLGVLTNVVYDPNQKTGTAPTMKAYPVPGTPPPNPPQHLLPLP